MTSAVSHFHLALLKATILYTQLTQSPGPTYEEGIFEEQPLSDIIAHNDNIRIKALLSSSRQQLLAQFRDGSSPGDLCGLPLFFNMAPAPGEQEFSHLFFIKSLSVNNCSAR